MNTTLPSGRTGQVIAVLLLLLVLSTVWRLLAAPMIDFYDVRRLDIEQRSMQAAHLKALADALPSLRATPGTDTPLPVMTLSGATDSVAAASLQGAIQEMVRSVGANLGSVEIVPSEMAEGLRRIGLKVTLSGSAETIARLLMAIEQAEPPILVDELQIHGNAMALPGTGPRSDPRLDANFVVYAFRRDPLDGQSP
jgi:hypothetical protein